MKKSRRLLSILLAVVCFITSSSVVFAAESNQVEDYRDQVSRMVQKYGMDATVTLASNEEITELKSALDEKFKEIGLNKKLTDNNFVPIKETETEASILKVKDNKSNTVVYLAFSAYENETGEIVLVQTTYNPSSRDILKLEAKKLYTEIEAEVLFFEFSEYTNDTSTDAIVPYGFSWNGRSFQCGMAGVVACLSYCFGWNLVGVVPGLVCEAVCGTAMVAACSVGP